MNETYPSKAAAPLRISEIFYSIQGEGVLVGVPSVFVRVSGCNLRCTWCDTPYTSWAPEGSQMTIDEIVAQVRAYSAARHVVVTGGEPLIFEPVVALTQRLRAAGLHITVETAGTAYLSGVACDLMSISPKLRNSIPTEREGGRFAAMHDSARYRPEVLRQLLRDFPYQLKFVATCPECIEEVRAMVSELGADPERVLLMPEGRDAATVAQRGRWLAELCKAEGWRYSPRLHVDLWGDLRGR